MSPDVTVVIPTFRRGAALERTLRALVGQEVDAGWEIVVCDDGSPESDAAQIAAAVETAQRHAGSEASEAGVRGSLLDVRLIRQENAGPAAARNAAARAARAPLLVFLDDDCLPVRGTLETHYREHKRSSGIAVLGHVAWAPALRVTPFMELVMRGAQFNYGTITDAEQVPFTCFYTANCSLRRADLEAAGWFDATLPPYLEDTEFAYRLMRAGTRIVYRPQALVHHEHEVELAPYLDRQRKAGRAAVQVVEKHPELFDVVGVGSVADTALREQFYSTLLRYAFVVGVEEALAERVTRGAITGAELRSTFEQWIAQWAVREAANTRAWRERSEALEREVARRDAQLAAVVQDKDSEIARLETELARFNQVPPVRLYHALKGIFRRGRRTKGVQAHVPGTHHGL